MIVSGFVLAGGQSSRMGADKALLPWAGGTLAGHVASTLRQAAGSAVLLGDPARYGHLGFDVLPDLVPGRGPLGALHTALRSSGTPWNLIVACDMPFVTAHALRILVDLAAGAAEHCVVPLGRAGPEPLCAVYHAACLPAVEKALAEGRLTMRNVIRDLDPLFTSALDPACFANLNTPADLAFARSGSI